MKATASAAPDEATPSAKSACDGSPAAETASPSVRASVRQTAVRVVPSERRSPRTRASVAPARGVQTFQNVFVSQPTRPSPA